MIIINMGKGSRAVPLFEASISLPMMMDDPVKQADGMSKSMTGRETKAQRQGVLTGGRGRPALPGPTASLSSLKTSRISGYTISHPKESLVALLLTALSEL